MSLQPEAASRHATPGALRTLRLRFMFWGVLALLCAQGLYGLLAVSALHKQYRGPMLTVQALACDDMGQRLGRMARLGKPLERIQQLDAMLEPFRATTSATEMYVTGASGSVLAAWDASRVGTIMPPPPSFAPLAGTNAGEFEQDGTTWLMRPITGKHGLLAGHVYMKLDAARMETALARVFAHTPLLTAITGASCLMLILLCTMLFRQHAVQTGNAGLTGIFSGRRAQWALLLPLILGQLCFMAATREPLRNLHEQQSTSIGEQLASQLGRELSGILSKGVALDSLPGIDSHLVSLQKGLKRVTGIGVEDTTGRVLFAADSGGPLAADAWNEKAKGAPGGTFAIATPNDGRQGTVRVLMSTEAIAAGLRETLLDTATVAVVAILFMVELSGLLLLQAQRRVTPGTPALSDMAGFMRPVIFFCMFAIDLSISFIPLRLAELDSDLFGLPRDVVMGLPISFEMFMVGLAIILGGFWSERRGWRPLLLCGIALCIVGYTASGLATTAITFILARGLAGAGYGCINLAAQVFVVARSTEANRAGNLATMFVGLFAGVLCASATGGILADRLGYAPVFLVAAALMFLVGLAILACPPRSPWMPQQESCKALPSWRELKDFLCDRQMAALLFCNIMPCAFVTVCLFQFFVPVQLSESGSSPADIGRVSMLFSLVVVCLGPTCGRLVDASRNKQWLLALAGAFGALAVVAFIIGQGLWAAVTAVAFLGLCNAVASNAQGAYALCLPATARFGGARAIGVYNTVERIGQVLGPVTFGVIMALWGTGAGLLLMAIVMGGMSLLFVALAAFPAQQEAMQEHEA